MADGAAQAVVRALTQIQVINGRVYAASMASVTDPVFPCITFERLTPGGIGALTAPVEAYRLSFSCYSEKSRDEAWAVYEAADALLDGRIFKSGATRYVVRRLTTPTVIPDTTGKTLYRVLLDYQVRQLG